MREKLLLICYEIEDGLDAVAGFNKILSLLGENETGVLDAPVAEFAVKKLKQYAEENHTHVRTTSDISPLEEWLLIELHKAENLPIPDVVRQSEQLVCDCSDEKLWDIQGKIVCECGKYHERKAN